MNEALLILFCFCIILGYMTFYVSKVELFNLTIPMTFSREGSYVTFDPSEVDLNEFHFQVGFRTLKESGLILMVQTVTSGYLMVYLEQGFIKVTLAPERTGDTVHLQSYSDHLNDDVDHSLTIIISRFTNKVDLLLNNNQEVSVEAGIHERPLSEITHACLGGLSPQLKKVYKDTFDLSVYAHLSFKGCLVEPRINSKDITGLAFLHDTVYGCLS